MQTTLVQDPYSNNEEIQNILKDNIYEPNYFSLFFGLFLVIGLVYLTSIIYQKLTKIKTKQNSDNLDIEIISTTPLGQNKNLHIIKIKDEYSLIGATQTNINLIKELKAPPQNPKTNQEK